MEATERSVVAGPSGDASAVDAARLERKKAIAKAQRTLDQIVDGKRRPEEEIREAACVLPHRTIEVAAHLLQRHELEWLADRFPSAVLMAPARTPIPPYVLEGCARRVPAVALEHSLGRLPKDVIDEIASYAPAAAARFAAPVLSNETFGTVVIAAPSAFLEGCHGSECWARLSLPLIPMLAERDPQQTLLKAGARMLRENMMSVVEANPMEALPAFVTGAIVFRPEEDLRLFNALRAAVVATADEDGVRAPTLDEQDELMSKHLLWAVEEYGRDVGEMPSGARERVRQAARWAPELALRVATRWLTDADVDEIAVKVPAAALKHAPDRMSPDILEACAAEEPIVALAHCPEYLSSEGLQRAEQAAARLLESGEPIPGELAFAFDVSRAPGPKAATGPGM